MLYGFLSNDFPYYVYTFISRMQLKSVFFRFKSAEYMANN